jgi:hypothetical protein
MNNFEIKLRHISSNDKYVVDGLEFNNAVFIKLLIDGKPIESYKFLDVALVVFGELVRSLSGDGWYLIFTSASGIADDGGWEGVEVRYDNGTVVWKFEVEDEIYRFDFHESEYRDAIHELEKKINMLPADLRLEPTEIFFPESWD